MDDNKNRQQSQSGLPKGDGQETSPELHLMSTESADTPSMALGEQIWARYGRSPGSIPLTTSVGLARRISRFSNGRLPLLATIQRRWMPTAVPFAYETVKTPFALFSGLPSKTDTVQRANQAPLFVQPQVREKRPLVTAQASNPVRRETLPPLAPNIKQQGIALKADTVPLDLGQAIVQRHFRGAPGRVIQRQTVPQTAAGRESSRQSTLQAMSTSSSGTPLVVRRMASVEIQEPVNLAADSSRQPQPASTPTNTTPEVPVRPVDYDVAKAVWQRHQTGPGEQIIQRLAVAPSPTTTVAAAPIVVAQRVLPFNPAGSKLQRQKDDLVVEAAPTIIQRQKSADETQPLPVVTPGQGMISMTGDGRYPLPTLVPVERQLLPTVQRQNISYEAASTPIQLSRAPAEMTQPQLPVVSASPGIMLLRMPMPDSKSTTIEQPLPLAISRVNGHTPQIARQVETESSASDIEATAVDSENSTEETGEVDLAQLAEQVSRLLKSQLIIERERRGIGRWN